MVKIKILLYLFIHMFLLKEFILRVYLNRCTKMSMEILWQFLKEGKNLETTLKVFLFFFRK